MSALGVAVLGIHNDEAARVACRDWVSRVEAWLAPIAPDSGLIIQWHTSAEGLVIPLLDGAERVHAEVKNRLRWLENLPARLSTIGGTGPINRQTVSRERPQDRRPYVSLARIEELRRLNSASYSTVRLCRLCEELNQCAENSCYMAAIMILRAIKDHVPRVFGVQNFGQVVAGTSGASLKAQFLRLHQQATDVADRYLHAQIGKFESLPTDVQIHFQSELDALLGEVAERLRLAE